ncbi:MAG: sensor histidine kinase [Gaiellaceae bacterium]
MADERFARLVSIACHDIRTPLATVHGFARTLARVELADPAPRYVEMIEEASTQVADLLDQLVLVTRIAEGRYQPTLSEVDSLELARRAAADVGEEPGAVSGEGAPVRVDEAAVQRAVGQLFRAARRHGGLDAIVVTVRGPVIELGPITKFSGPVISGESLKELGAPAAVIVVEALGGGVEIDGVLARIRLPE